MRVLSSKLSVGPKADKAEVCEKASKRVGKAEEHGGGSCRSGHGARGRLTTRSSWFTIRGLRSRPAELTWKGLRHTSRRRYHSPLRADQAGQTRRRVLEAAFRLFVDRGYGGTTVAAVAEQAGVSDETIYLSLGGKRGLLEGVIEMAIAGEDNPAKQESAWWGDVAQLPGAAERLAKMVEYSCRILARTRPIHAVIRGAADKEVFAATLGKRLLHDRLTNQTERISEYLGDHLRTGLSVAEAGQRYCALASPELYYLLTGEFGWTADQHRKWLTDLVETDLLGPRYARPSASAASPRRRGDSRPAR